MQAPEELASSWDEMLRALASNAVDDAELAPQRFDVPNAQRAELVSSLLRRVLAAGSAVERTRVRIVLAMSRAAEHAPDRPTL